MPSSSSSSSFLSTTTKPRHFIAITTSNPSSSSSSSVASSGSGSGSLIVLDSHSLAIVSSLRTTTGGGDNTTNSNNANHVTGLSSLSPFPSYFVHTAVAAATSSSVGTGQPQSATNTTSSTIIPMLAFGGNPLKRGDTYASLLSLRCNGSGGSTSASSIVTTWKCRLPEPDLYQAGLLVSPCGHYVIGGGKSGSCYVWSTIGSGIDIESNDNPGNTTMTGSTNENDDDNNGDGGGQLLRTFQAHYRGVTSMCWCNGTGGNGNGNGRCLVTGGEDGMIHVFSMMDLVTASDGTDAVATNNNNKSSRRTIPSLHTFSVHHVPVTHIISLDSGRIASASDDGMVVIMEVFSEQVILTLQLPHGVSCLTYHTDGRLFAGSNRGTIYSIDLNDYAIHQTEQRGATLVTKRRRQNWQRHGATTQNSTLQEMVFGVGTTNDTAKKGSSSSSNTTTAGGNDTTAASYQTDWIGHNHAVTSIELVPDDNLLISGDSSGQVRLWSLEFMSCLKVLQPWSSAGTSNTSSSTNSKKHPKGHPVTSIQIIPQPTAASSSANGGGSNSMIFGGGGGGSGKKYGSLSNLLPPLQKYSAPDAGGGRTTRIPYIQPNTTIENAAYWSARPILRKRRRRHHDPQPLGKSQRNTTTSSQQLQQQQEQHKDVLEHDNDHRDNTTTSRNENDNNNENDEESSSLKQGQDEEEIDTMRAEIEALRSQLKEKQSTIERWETVNNKLMQRLQQSKK